MARITYIIIDEKEGRNSAMEQSKVDSILACLTRNPDSIDDLDEYHKELTGEALYDHGNRPKVPDELTIEEIRRVLGFKDEFHHYEDDEYVKYYWEKVSYFREADYGKSVELKDASIDLPESTLANWERDKDLRSNFDNDINRYKKERYGTFGVVIINLCKKEINHITDFEIPRNKSTYSLPEEWKLIPG